MSATSTPAEDVKSIVFRNVLLLVSSEHVAEAQTARSADCLRADGL
jgi:hypothetical protein